MDDQHPVSRVKQLCLAALALAAILFVTGLLFPGHNIQRPASFRIAAKNDARQIVAAVKHFYMEYGRYPSATADGLIEDGASNARHFNILRAVDTEANPRKVIFFEGRNATLRKGRLAAGFDPATGTFLDPWGS